MISYKPFWSTLAAKDIRTYTRCKIEDILMYIPDSNE